MPPDDIDIGSDDDGAMAAIRAAMAEHAEPLVEQETGDPAPIEPVARARAADGKFVKADGADDGADADASAAQKDAPAEGTDPPASEQDSPPAEQEIKGADAPANWPAADRDMFRHMPPIAQEFLLRRHRDMEADYTRKSTEIANFRREYEPVQQLLAPYDAALRQRNLTPARMVAGYIEIEKRLDAPGGAIAVISDLVNNPQYRVDKGALARALGFSGQSSVGTEPPAPGSGSAGDWAPGSPSPEILAELASIKQAIAQDRRAAGEWQQREAEAQSMSQITMFRDAKDPNGNLLHPHFGDVEGEMLRLAEGARAIKQPIPPLDELYETAVWANPSTRAHQRHAAEAAKEAQLRAAEATRAREARAKAAQASRAGSSVTGSPGTGQTSAPTITGDLSANRFILDAIREHAA